MDSQQQNVALLPLVCDCGTTISNLHGSSFKRRKGLDSRATCASCSSIGKVKIVISCNFVEQRTVPGYAAITATNG